MSVYSFGIGVNGELGHGDVECRDFPKKIQFFSDINKRVKKIACGSYHTVYITDDEEMYMTGISRDPKSGSTLFIVDNSPSSKSQSNLGGSGSTPPNNVSSPKLPRIPHTKSTRNLLNPTLEQEDSQLQQLIQDFNVLNTPPHSSPEGSSSRGSPLSTSMAPQTVDYEPPRIIPQKISLSFLGSSPLNTIKQVALGNYHILVLTESGDVWSWGSNSYGQLGIGSTNPSKPRQIELKCVKMIAAGVKHSGAINEWGELYMWGINAQGELGLGDFENRLSPTRVTRLKSEFVTQIAFSSTHSACVTDSGRLYSWGQVDKQGKIQTVPTMILQTGDGSFEVEADGGGYGGGGEIRQICCGEWQIAALTQMGEVFLWEVGGKPVPIHHLLSNYSVRAIAMGNFHLLCLTDSGELVTLGRNKSGQLGRLVPPNEGTNIPGLVKELSYDPSKTATSADAAKSTNSPNTSRTTTPSSSPYLNEKEFVVAIQAGEYHSVALVENTPKTKLAIQLLKLQRHYLRQLQILHNVYYKSLLSISTPSDPLISQLLSMSSGGGGGSSASTPLSSSTSSAGSGSLSSSVNLSSSRDLSSSGHSMERSMSLSSSGYGPTPITAGGSTSSPSLLPNSGAGGSSSTRDSVGNGTTKRNPSMATIRGIFGLNAITNIGMDEVGISITEEEVVGIFSDTKALIRSTQVLLNSFDQRVDSCDSETLKLGDLFLVDSVLSSYRVYIPFSDNYNSACMTLFNVKKRSEKVANMLKECEKRSLNYGVKLDQSYTNVVDLKSLLLSPLQNIPRIYMMLKELSLASGAPNHQDVQLLNLSAGKLHVLFERMNQNFQFVDAVEILNCTSNDYGNPQILGGSLIQLVDKLTHHNISDPNFCNVFLLTFRAFTQPLHLLSLLIDKYEKQPVTRAKVINFINMWVVSFYYDFENDPLQSVLEPGPDHQPQQLCDKLEKFINSNIGGGLINGLKHQYEDQKNKDYQLRYNALSINIPQVVTPPNIVFLDQNPTEIAQTLTLLNHLYFSKIDKREFLNQRWTKKRAPNIQLSTEHFNRISQLVVSEIVNQKTSKLRASVMTHFIAIANGCFELNNFTGVSAIIFGLNSSTIAKLKKTWGKLSKDSQSKFDYLEKIVTPLKNYISLRHIMATIQPPCIPFLGLYLKDLTFIEDGNPAVIGGLINFYKQRKIAEVITQIQQYQHVSYTGINVNVAIRDYILAAPVLDEKKAQSIASSLD